MGRAILRLDVGIIKGFLKEGLSCVRPHRPLYDVDIEAVQLNHTNNSIDLVLESPDIVPADPEKYPNSVPEILLSFNMGCGGWGPEE